MTTTTYTETHELVELQETDAYPRMAGLNFYAECTCHNPDGNGDGRCDFWAATVEEIQDMHHDHRLSVGAI